MEVVATKSGLAPSCLLAVYLSFLGKYKG